MDGIDDGVSFVPNENIARFFFVMHGTLYHNMTYKTRETDSNTVDDLQLC
jgi:hypothetical protein